MTISFFYFYLNGIVGTAFTFVKTISEAVDFIYFVQFSYVVGFEFGYISPLDFKFCSAMVNNGHEEMF